MSKSLQTIEQLNELVASDVYRMVDYTMDKNGLSRFSQELEDAIFDLSHAVQHLSDMLESEADRNDKYLVKEIYRDI
jgi:GTP1/Obg family GTP-binding protein